MRRFSRRTAPRNRLLTLALALALCAASIATPASGRWAVSADGTVEDQQLEDQLSAFLSRQDGIFGVAVINLVDGRTVLINSNTDFPTASMYKLLVMYRVFQLIEKGDLSPNNWVEIVDSDVAQDEPEGGLASGDTPTIAEALDAMITISSNAAASVLIRQVGGMDRVEAAARELGMNDTYQVNGELWSTPSDLAHFFLLLANQSLVSRNASVQMIGLLLRQTLNGRIPALLPPEAAVAHKTGEMDDVWNDGGIVYGTGGRYIIVLMSRGGTPEDEIQVEAEISEMVYDQYGK